MVRSSVRAASPRGSRASTPHSQAAPPCLQKHCIRSACYWAHAIEARRGQTYHRIKWTFEPPLSTPPACRRLAPPAASPRAVSLLCAFKNSRSRRCQLIAPTRNRRTQSAGEPPERGRRPGSLQPPGRLAQPQAPPDWPAVAAHWTPECTCRRLQWRAWRAHRQGHSCSQHYCSPALWPQLPSRAPCRARPPSSRAWCRAMAPAAWRQVRAWGRRGGGGWEGRLGGRAAAADADPAGVCPLPATLTGANITYTYTVAPDAPGLYDLVMVLRSHSGDADL